MSIIVIFAAVLMVVLLFIGTPVPIALGFAGMTGLYALVGDGALLVAAKVFFDTLNDFILLAIPLFILMGTVLAKGGVGEKLYKLFDVFLRGIPGGVGIATICTCAVLAAMCGTSVAIAAMVGSFAISNLLKYGYSFPLSMGICVAGGALGILIPPSVPMIVYSAFCQESAGQLFMAGVVPGVLAVLLFSLYIAWSYLRQPNRVKVESTTWNEKMIALKEGVWAALIPVGIMVPLYAGIATPTEIAALGVLWSFIVSVYIYRNITYKDIIPILKEGLNGTVMVTFIICGAMLFGNAVTQLGLGRAISEFFVGSGLSSWVFIIITMFIMLALGCFLEGASIMLIMIPVILPTLLGYQLNLIWYAVIMVINIEVGLLTPPVGLNLYAVDGVAKGLGFPSTISIVIRGTWPFMALYVLCLILVAVFPQLATWIPNNMLR
ncbi:MAG: C4-dicarboxylate ABC transporter permease [Firmicutes bacterium HGW-Firmicutes-12]|jgi:C4-dicarboxylate transporter DctM subunit|nr:MAG: C4-dicarboxylate ABC transporter permease [Firmicutes bacterium HGW-Firmicutes-12]